MEYIFYVLVVLIALAIWIAWGLAAIIGRMYNNDEGFWFSFAIFPINVIQRIGNWYYRK